MQPKSLLVLALALATAGLAHAQDQASSKPDIVVILADDMGFSDIGCYGSEIATPNLDRLAAGGLRFTQFYNTGRCCPTRASLLTGLYSHQAGVGWMMSDRGIPGYRGDLSHEAVTIAEALQAGGYGTYMSGKWHVTPFRPAGGSQDNWPRSRGFDRFFGTIHGAGSFYDPNSLALDDERIVPGEDFYYTTAIADHAIDFIDEHVQKQDETPLFLYAAFTAPHWPMHALPEDIERYAGRYNEGWDALRAERHARMIELGIVDEDWGLTERDAGVPAWEDAEQRAWHIARMQVYAAMIDSMDQSIGRILDRLEAHGRLENTLVLFLADNGGCAEEYGSRGPESPDPSQPVVRMPMGAQELQDRMIPSYTRSGEPVRTGEGVIPGPENTYISYGKGWANASNTPFRRYKHWVHEGGISTPLIVHWPAGLRRHGELEEQPGHLIDIMATCIDAAGVEYPKQYAGHTIQPMEGLSLLPTFTSQELERKALFWEHEGNRAVRVGDWKLVAAGKKGPWELFDLSKDRTELHDLSRAQPERTEKLAALWQAWAERAHVLPLNPPARPRAAPNKQAALFDFSQFPKGGVQLVGQESHSMLPESDAECRWVFEGGVLSASPAWDSVVTPESYQDFRMHLEFNVNDAPGKDREADGNSGVYIQQRYEIQILNSHATSPEDYKASDAGSIYRLKKPDQLVSKPAGQWQSYDILFRAARFEDESKTENAQITVYQNGVLIHDTVSIQRKTGAGQAESPEARPIKLQGHHNVVRFRNVWIEHLSLDRMPAAPTSEAR